MELGSSNSCRLLSFNRTVTFNMTLRFYIK
ncbi:hypothetical protein H206_06170 [Candidatus Electrothrix aarhusensis]|uniref:Uncharacterized protein n=1 Tax=Candidatus Electrothrix aarhusensis TaxID=1859131 RepID=A0A444J3Q1_9BACT|nr:hypothetical protein H206_06170 [Candidatus Electrothrix aarhusensis]